MLMKLKNLLILGALLLSGSASATIVDGVRQKPVPSFVDMQFDQVQYLYNVKAEKYWLGANDWSTQASVGDDGWKMKVYKHLDANGEWDNKTVTMQDSVQNGSYAGKWLKAWFVSGGNTMYTDHNGQADTLWVIQKVGGVYRLSASAENTATVVWAADGISALSAQASINAIRNLADNGKKGKVVMAFSSMSVTEWKNNQFSIYNGVYGDYQVVSTPEFTEK